MGQVWSAVWDVDVGGEWVWVETISLNRANFRDLTSGKNKMR